MVHEFKETTNIFPPKLKEMKIGKIVENDIQSSFLLKGAK